MKWVSALAVFFLAVGASACGGNGVGDPCTLPHPALQPGQTACSDGGSCFEGSEIYIETLSLQCRTHVCMIYHWDEVNDPTGRPLREFCTCKCGGPGDPSTFCQCPSDFQCVTAFETGEPGIVGSYCVRSEVAPDAGDGGSH